MDTVGNILGLIGIILLSVPAFYANKYANLIYRVRRSQPNYEDPTIKSDREKATKQLEAIRDQWTPFKSFCLIAGTILAGLSYLLPLVKAFLGWLA